MRTRSITFAAMLAAICAPAGATEVVYLGPNQVATVRCDDGSYRSAESIEAAAARCPVQVAQK